MFLFLDSNSFPMYCFGPSRNGCLSKLSTSRNECIQAHSVSFVLRAYIRIYYAIELHLKFNIIPCLSLVSAFRFLFESWMFLQFSSRFRLCYMPAMFVSLCFAFLFFCLFLYKKKSKRWTLQCSHYKPKKYQQCFI